MKLCLFHQNEKSEWKLLVNIFHTESPHFHSFLQELNLRLYENDRFSLSKLSMNIFRKYVQSLASINCEAYDIHEQ